MKITLKDGSVKEFTNGMSALEVLSTISTGLTQNTVAVEVDGVVRDAFLPLQGDCSLNAILMGDEKALPVIRHTASHVMAQAVKRLFPSAKLAIGPSIETGFYYDFDLEQTFSIDDLARIEEVMAAIIKQNDKLERFVLPRDEAIAYMASQEEPYKVELIRDLPEDAQISFYRQGDFVDLCAGPHVPSTDSVKAFKLLSVAGAYWRGSEKNKMLQRIYGTAFDKEKNLKEYLRMLEEAKERDHRKLGRELDLYTVDDYVGPGLVLWHPKLSAVREQIEQYWRQEHRRRGYEYVYTPNVGKSNLWETSGHLVSFAEGMYPPMAMAQKDKDEQFNYYVKPMNCPFHIRIYKSRKRSYRELPIRYCELGNVYRYEKSGTLHGMMRVRGFTQDDAHIFCREDQFVDEVNGIIDFALEINRVMGFNTLKVYLSVRSEEDRDKYIGEERIWSLAETTLETILNDRNMAFHKDIGGAKFYGPSIDLKAVDAMGREWQGTTIQLDMNEPGRFNMTYVGADDKEYVPIMLHRTLLGSMERFVGTLIEHYGGAFPLWMAPEQVRVLTITNRVDDYAKSIEQKLRLEDVRVSLDARNEKIGFKIREAQTEKIPYILVIGDKEAEQGSVAVRKRGVGDQGAQPFDDFGRTMREEINDKIIF